MKHFLKSVLLILVFLGTLSAFAHPAQNSNETFKEFKSTYGGVVFSVDPRIELFHAVELGSGTPQINPIEIDYKQKVDKEVSKYKNHPLFSFIKRNTIYNKLFNNSIDAPIWFLLNLTKDFEWRKDVTYADRNNLLLDSFRYYLKRFVDETDYIRFFNSNADFYNISLATLKFNLEDFNEKDRVLNYYGVQNKEANQFNIILNFFGWGNFGSRLSTKKRSELYAVIAPERSFMRIPTFDQVRLYKLIWHEFGHSFANPAVQKQPYLSQIEALSHLHTPIKESMKAQAYATWPSVVWEHLTEAVACRLAAQKFGEQYADLNFVRLQKGMRWIYLNPLLAALKEYEQNRTKYPTLEDFMPQIVRTLQNVTQSDIDKWMAQTEAIRKPDVERMPVIQDVFGRDSVMIILSSNEKDKAADGRLKAFLQERFFPLVSSLKKATVLTDTAAAKMNLSPYNLLVIGTPSGNKVLTEMLGQIPILFTEKSIIGEKIYEGKGYALLAGWVNPYNTAKVMTVMAATNPDDLVDFNQVPFGWTNYHIMKNFITYKTGDFMRYNLVWLCK